MSIGEVDFGWEVSKGVVAKFVMALIGFAGSIVFARILGPGGYGAFYVLLALVHILDNPVTGWGVACKKRLSEADFPTDEALGSGFIGVALSVLVIVPAVAVLQSWVELYPMESAVPFAVLFTSVSLFAVTNRLLSGTANFSIAEWTDTLRSVFTLPLQLGLVFLGYGVAGMVYGLALATLLTVPYVLKYVGVPPALPSRETVSSITSYARYSIPSNFLGSAQSRVDVILIGLILTSAGAGLYEVALKLTMPATFIAGVTSAGLMARVSNLQSQSKPIDEDVTNALGYTSLLAVPVFFGALAIPEALMVTIYGPDFRAAALLLVGLALYQLLSTQVVQLGSTLAGLDRPRVVMWTSAVALTLNVVVGYALLLEFGVIGVIVATLLAESVKYTVYAGFVKLELVSIRILPRPFVHQLLAGLVMFVLLLEVRGLISVQSWLELVFIVSIGGVAYFTTLTAISLDFRTTVRGILADAVGQ